VVKSDATASDPSRIISVICYLYICVLRVSRSRPEFLPELEKNGSVKIE